MIRFPSYAAVLTLLATVAAQSPALPTCSAAGHGQSSRTLAWQALAAAQAAGGVTTPAERIAMKQAFYALACKQGRTPAHRRLDAAIRPTTSRTTGNPEAVVAQEHEFNDSWRWADPLGGNTVARGNNATFGDVDTWTYVSTGQFVTFAVTGTGSAPILDSTITVKDSQGDVVAFADTAGTESSSLYLPPGTFHVEVGAWVNTFTTPSTYEGGSYDLTITSATLNTGTTRILAASANGTTQVPAGAGHDVFRFSLPSDSRVALRATSTGDTVLCLQRSNGTVVFVNDDSTALGLSAAADVDLLSGTYYAYVSDFGGTAGLAYTLTLTVTPLVLPNVATTAFVTGTLNGPESLRLYRCNLQGNQAVSLTTATNGSGAGDTVLSVLDRRFGLMVENDDAITGYARLSGSLPVGNWLVAVTPFPGAAGGYSLTTTVGAPYLSSPLAFGSNSVAIPATPGAFATYHVGNCTETSTRLRVPSANGGEYTLMDSNGVIDSVPGFDWYPQCVELPGGTSHILVFDRLAAPGAFTLDVLPTLAVQANRVRTQSKEGDAAVLLATLAPLTTGVNLGLGDRGILCLQLGTIATVGLQIVGPSGVVDWAAAPPVPYNINLQQGDLHTGAVWTPGFFGSWRNVLRL